MNKKTLKLVTRYPIYDPDYAFIQGDALKPIGELTGGIGGRVDNFEVEALRKLGEILGFDVVIEKKGITPEVIR